MIKVIKRFWKDESGIGVIEVVLILVVLIGLVFIFKNQLTSIMVNIFEKIESKTNSLF